MDYSPINDILEDLRAGKFVVLVDDEDRENEGDLVIAAEPSLKVARISPRAFGRRWGGDILVVSLPGRQPRWPIRWSLVLRSAAWALALLVGWTMISRMRRCRCQGAPL